MIKTQYTYPFLRNSTLQAHRNNYFNFRALCIEHFSDCYGIPYRALKKGDSNIVGGGLYISSGVNVGTLYDCDYLSCKNDVKGDIVYIGHVSSACWGHTITDSIARLWYIISQCENDSFSKLPIYYISESTLEGNYLAFIKLLGIQEERLHRINRVTKFKSVYLPDVCFDNRGVSLRYSAEYVNLIDEVIRRSGCSSIPSPQKIFLIKKNSMRQVCSKDIICILNRLGYVIIHPEKLSVSSQICIFRNAEIIVSEESSLSHNLIFCREGSKVIILRKANTINIYQALINKIRNLDVTYIDCHLSLLAHHPQRGPFFLYANEYFCNFFKQEQRTFPYKDFYLYLRNACGTDILKRSHDIDTNYKTIIEDILSTYR